MASELRDFFTDAVIRDIARDLKRAHPAFQDRRFVTAAIDGLAPLSLTGRAAHIANAMRVHLPTDFAEAADILLRSLGARHGSSDTFGACVWWVPNTSAWPSAAACAPRRVPIAPAPPGTFSTTTDWPSAFASSAPTVRARMSVGPPAGYGTTIVTGRDGAHAPRVLRIGGQSFGDPCNDPRGGQSIGGYRGCCCSGDGDPTGWRHQC